MNTKIIALIATILIASASGTSAYILLQPQQETEIVGDEPLVVSPTSEPIPQNVSGSTIYAENSTIIAGEGSQIINPDPTATPTPQPTPTPTPQPTLTVTFNGSETTIQRIYTPDAQDAPLYTMYFKIESSKNIFSNTPSGQVNSIIVPLAAKYGVVIKLDDDADWRLGPINGGWDVTDTWMLTIYAYNTLNSEQVELLTQDLQDGFMKFL